MGGGGYCFEVWGDHSITPYGGSLTVCLLIVNWVISERFKISKWMCEMSHPNEEGMGGGVPHLSTSHCLKCTNYRLDCERVASCFDVRD